MQDILKALTDSGSDDSLGWVTKLVILIIGLSVIAVFAWSSWRNGKKLAKLEHERDVLEEEKHQAELDNKLDALERRKEEALADIAAIDDAVASLEDEKRLNDKRHEEALKDIDSIDSWDDIK